MKNVTSTRNNILLKALDIELKAIIQKDLKKFRTMKQQTKNSLEFIRQMLAA